MMLLYAERIAEQIAHRLHRAIYSEILGNSRQGTLALSLGTHLRNSKPCPASFCYHQSRRTPIFENRSVRSLSHQLPLTPKKMSPVSAGSAHARLRHVPCLRCDP